MRDDSQEYASFSEAQTKEPRFVIKLEYTTSSPHFTSKANIANVPGVPVQGVVKNLSAVSQQLFPEDGRTTIGGFTFDLIDLSSAVTDELRTQLSTNDEGPRFNTVEVFKGFSDDFNDPEWRLINTYILDNLSETTGGYQVRCTDITRELNDTIFDQKKTTLRLNISATATTIPVADTTDFQTVFHGTSYSDAPSSTVGYVTIEESGEIIRYTGTVASPAQLTGCTRGVFGTTAKAITIDAQTAQDQRPEITEFIYLELPAPMLMYAIETGIILGTSSPVLTLPSHWHRNLATKFVRLTDFQNIGEDLFVTTDETLGLVSRFTHLEKQNGKAFVETELHPMMGTFSPIYSTGEIGLQRMNRILADAAFDVQLDHTNITRLGTLKHDQTGVVNRFRIDWNWNGDKFTRSNAFVDNDSIVTHGATKIKTLKLKGLHGARHTVPVLRQIIDMFRDRFSGPPQLLQVTVLPSLDVLEVGDVVRVVSAAVRDYAGTATLNRSFEVQQRSEDLVTGQVKLTLFASSQEKDDQSPTSVDPALQNNFYDQEGIDLDSLANISGGVTTGDVTLVGGADMNASASVWYHLGALTISVGDTLFIQGNVQLRIRGFFTVNGTIDGIGQGEPGTTDLSTIGVNVVTTVAPVGYIGRTLSGYGVARARSSTTNFIGYVSWSGSGLRGRSSWPQLVLQVTSTGSPLVETIEGIPTDFRGGGGSHGAPIVDAIPLDSPTAEILGGPGASGGGGLLVVCRGMGFGVSAAITLTAANATSPASATFNGVTWFPGSGAGGGPGAFLILLDGNALTVPDLSGVFVSASGLTPSQGTVAVQDGSQLTWDGPEPLSGLDQAQRHSGVDYSNSAARIQYVPQETTAVADADLKLSPPTALTARSTPPGVQLGWVDPDTEDFSHVEIFRSLDNDRTNSVLIDTAQPAEQQWVDVNVTADRQYFYWIRARDVDNRTSDFENGGASPVTTTLAFVTFIAVLPTPVFFESFDNYEDTAAFEQTWENIFNTDSAVTFPEVAAEAEFGGRVFQGAANADSPPDSQSWYSSRRLIPYDPKELYKITIRARQTVAGGTSDNVFFGVEGVNEDGITLIAADGGASHGNQHYIAANQWDMGQLSLNTWKNFVGFVTGHTGVTANARTAINSLDRDDHFRSAAMRTGVKYMRALFVGNWNRGNGTIQISFVKIEIVPKFVAQQLLDPTFDLREDDLYWKLDQEPNGVDEATIINAGGENGSNACSFDFTASPAPDNISIRQRTLVGIQGRHIRVRIRYRVTGHSIVSPDTRSIAITVPGYRTQPEGRAVLGSDSVPVAQITGTQIDNSGGWATVTFLLSLGALGTSDVFFINFVVTNFNGDVRFDRIELEMFDEFQGAASLGALPDPVAETGKIIDDAGDWVAPSTSVSQYYGSDASVSPTAVGFHNLPSAPSLTQNVTRLIHENTVTETAIFSFSIPAGAIGVGQIAHFFIDGSLFNNSGAVRNQRWRFTLGGTTFYDLGTGTGRQVWVAINQRRPWRMQIDIGARAHGSPPSTYINMMTMIAGPGGNLPATGRNAWQRFDGMGADMYPGTPLESAGPIAVDLASAQTLEVLVQHDVANLSLEVTREMYSILLP